MKPIIIFLFLAVVANFSFSQNVGINTTAPDESALLEMSSDEKGFLLPRVSLTSTTDATTITNGNVDGLLVYNTNNSGALDATICYWYDTQWYLLGYGSQFEKLWEQTGTGVGAKLSFTGNTSNTELDDTPTIAGYNNTAGVTNSVIWGGEENYARNASFIGAGNQNTANNEATILSGFSNEITIDTENTLIASGRLNRIDSLDYSIIFNGISNRIGDEVSFELTESAIIGNGQSNQVNAGSAIILNGSNGNLSTSGVILNGLNNASLSSYANGANAGASLGYYSLILNGNDNTIGLNTQEFDSTLPYILSGSENEVIRSSGGNSRDGYSGIINGQENVIGGGDPGNDFLNSIIFSGVNNNIRQITPGTSTEVVGHILNGTNNSLMGSAVAIANGSDNSIAAGNNTDVSLSENSAILNGQRNILESTYSLIGNGQDNEISNASNDLTNNAILNGQNNSISSNFSVILNGINNTIERENSLVVNGQNNQAIGSNSLVAGYENTAYSKNEMVLGYAATQYTPISNTTAEATDRMFVIGNGSGSGGSLVRSDAFTLLKNGELGIGYDNFETNTSAALFQLNGDAYFENGFSTSTTNYPDYVFNSFKRGRSSTRTPKGYKLPEIKEMEKFIKEHGHLKGIPGRNSLSKTADGNYKVHLSELTILQLEKIEELFVLKYKQEQEILRKEKEIEKIINQLEQLEEILHQKRKHEKK